MNTTNQHPAAMTSMDALAQQALSRIEQMEAPDYRFPERFSRADWIGAIALLTLTGLWLIAGVWL